VKQIQSVVREYTIEVMMRETEKALRSERCTRVVNLKSIPCRCMGSQCSAAREAFLAIVDRLTTEN